MNLHEPKTSYSTVAVSFIEGLLRIWRAEAAAWRLLSAHAEFLALEDPDFDGPTGPVLRQLERVQTRAHDSFAYVTDLSHLVYATSLLDTFLNDTTVFLFLLHPGAMGKKQQIPLGALIDSTSRNEALTKAAKARAREISYLPFPGRIQFLQDRFGLSINIDDDARAALEHYSSVRNLAVHDQGIFDLRLDDSGDIRSSQKTCPRHPTPLNQDDFAKAVGAYEKVAQAVARAVFTQTLKCGDDPDVNRLIESFSPQDRNANDESN